MSLVKETHNLETTFGKLSIYPLYRHHRTKILLKLRRGMNSLFPFLYYGTSQIHIGGECPSSCVTVHCIPRERYAKFFKIPCQEIYDSLNLMHANTTICFRIFAMSTEQMRVLSSQVFGVVITINEQEEIQITRSSKMIGPYSCICTCSIPVVL